jgi:hypothetical protein
MNTIKLFRTVSQNEFDDWQQSGIFQTARNTLEAKQFLNH